MGTYDNYDRREPRRRTARRRPPKRRKPRYDRIAGVAVVFVIFIIILVACGRSCGGDKKTDESSIVPTEAKSQSQEKEEKKSSDSKAASLEKQPSEQVHLKAEDVNKGSLILVNKQNEYTFPSSEEESIVPIYDKVSGSYSVSDLETALTTDTVDALNNLMDAFLEKKGLSDCVVISGYRTKEYQDNLFDSGTTDIKGGCSDYHTGMSFDLGIFPEGGSSYYYVPEGDYSWINENCAKYGFIIRFPSGKESKTGVSDSKTYQFRYVGIPHAICMAENDLCLEEYIDFVKNYTYDGDHLAVRSDDNNYEIYYVKADESGETSVPVPSDKEYTISGNNVDGFIVTVELSGSPAGSSSGSSDNTGAGNTAAAGADDTESTPGAEPVVE